MNCSCGIPAFYYETIKSDDIKYSIYKCGALFSESKRGKCSLNLETALNKIKVPLQPTVCEIISKDAVQNDISETDISDTQISETQISETDISETQISETN